MFAVFHAIDNLLNVLCPTASLILLVVVFDVQIVPGLQFA